MEQKKNDDSIQKLEKTTCSNSLLIDAIFEILVEKNVLTGEEVMARIKKLRDDSLSNQALVH